MRARLTGSGRVALLAGGTALVGAGGVLAFMQSGVLAALLLAGGTAVLLLAAHAGEPPDATEEALRKKEEELRLLMDAVPALISHTDRDERYLFANRALAEVYGLRPEDMIGKTRCEIVGDAVYEYVKPYLQRALAGERVSYTRVNEQTGLTLALNLIPERDAAGNVIGLYGLHTDVTEISRAREALGQSEARFRALTELSSDWFWEQDEQFRFTKFEGEGERSPFPFEEAYGKRRWELGYQIAGGWEAHKQMLETIARFATSS